MTSALAITKLQKAALQIAEEQKQQGGKRVYVPGYGYVYVPMDGGRQ